MHPEADALLDAIFDNPDDDTPRLVYADWLQENGHEDYAQFIRLSCRIDRAVLPPDERAHLRRERHQLWKAITQSSPRAFDGLPLQSASFRRGILDRSLEMDAE